MTELKHIKFEVLLLILLNALMVMAQENKCNLKIRVFESENAISIIEAKISVKNLKSTAAFDNDGQFDTFIFSGLPEGDYEITTSKDNFKQGINKYKLVCNQLDQNGYKNLGIILYEGNPNEKVEFDEKDIVLRTAPALPQDERLKKFAKINNLLNSEATYLEKPKYPKAAAAVKASGVVYVKITIDEEGKIESAQAVSGHPLLRAAAVDAAKNAKFKPPVIDGKPVKISGLLVYNFLL